MGTTRRVRKFADPDLQIWFVLAAIGVVVIAIGIFGFLMSIVMGIVRREQLRDATGDPWHGRTLEWSTSSPPPEYNFAMTPVVHELDAWYDMKTRGGRPPAEGWRAIHLPRNTGTGVYLSALAAVLGFAMVWYIWWLAAAAFAGLIIVAIGHSFFTLHDRSISAEEVARIEGARPANADG